ncbi:MAG TPA: MDR family MFS transporter [Bryobacteraceae bacterium]|nr:MDR family MFS transporter [Bryobacteraceae bacterium]
MTTAAGVDRPGLHNLTRRQLAGTLTGLVLTLLLAALDQTIVGTSEPRIIASLNGFDRYPWVTTAYLLTSTIAVPIFAKLSDIYGRKWFFLTGNILFVTASAFCGAAGEVPFVPGDGMSQLIAFRGIQGLGAGIAMGLLFTIIGDIFPPAQRARYQGLFASVFGLASIFGPTLGGWITDQFSWRWTFYVNLPVGVIAAAAILIEFPYFRPHGVQRRIDWWGVLTLAGCLIPLLLALTWVTDYGWGSERVVSLLVVSGVMLLAFLLAESRAIEPVLPLSLYQNRIISVATVAVFLLGIAMFGAIIYIPLFMQGVLGVTATRSGSLLTPMMLGFVVASITSGNIIGRTGRYRIVVLSGVCVMAAGIFLMASMNGNTAQWEVIRNMIIAGLGMGSVMPVYTLAVQNVAPPTNMGSATASVQFFRSIGGTVGVAMYGSILLRNYHHSLAHNIPAGTPPRVLALLNNPLQLRQASAGTLHLQPADLLLVRQLAGSVKQALLQGLHQIFVIGSVLIVFAVAVNFFLQEVPLRKVHHKHVSAEP